MRDDQETGLLTVPMRNFIGKCLVITSCWSYSAFSGAVTYIYKTCSSADSSCGSCTEQDLEVTPKVNKSNGVVILNLQKDTKTNSSTLDNCQIVDDDNWSCIQPAKVLSTGAFSTRFSESGYKMIDGNLMSIPLSSFVTVNGKLVSEADIKPVFSCFVRKPLFRLF